MQINMEKLIEKVQAEHRVILNRNDPVFISVTLHQMVMEQTLKAINQQLENAFSQIRAGTREQNTMQIEAAKEIAAELITRAPDYIKSEIIRVAPDLSATIKKDMETIEARVKEHLDTINAARRSARIAMIITVAVAGITAGAIMATIAASCFS